MLSAPGFAASVQRGSSTETIHLSASTLADVTNVGAVDVLSLVARIDIASGKLSIKLDAEALATQLDLDPDRIDEAAISSSHPFQLRKRGVETKIILADQPAGRDDALLRNIARAHAWLDRIKAGETFAEIAKTKGTSKRRVQQKIDLVFHAPDIVSNVLNGKQPIGFTSDWCLRHDLPSNWTEQRNILAAL